MEVDAVSDFQDVDSPSSEDSWDVVDSGDDAVLLDEFGQERAVTPAVTAPPATQLVDSVAFTAPTEFGARTAVRLEAPSPAATLWSEVVGRNPCFPAPRGSGLLSRWVPRGRARKPPLADPDDEVDENTEPLVLRKEDRLSEPTRGPGPQCVLMTAGPAGAANMEAGVEYSASKQGRFLHPDIKAVLASAGLRKVRKVQLFLDGDKRHAEQTDCNPFAALSNVNATVRTRPAGKTISRRRIRREAPGGVCSRTGRA